MGLINSIGSYFQKLVTGFTFGTGDTKVTVKDNIIVEFEKTGGSTTYEYTFPSKNGTVALLDDINILSGATLTEVDDTNVTLSLGGTPTTALLRPVSLTLGWTGQLSVARGGTGIGTLTGVVVGTGTTAMTAVVGTASQLLRRNAGNTAYEFFTHDFVNQAGARSSISLTTTGSSGASTYSSATGVLNVPTYTLTGLGGFANPMTTLGDIIYGGASGSPTRLAGNITTAKQYLSQTGTSTVSAAPVWSTIAGSDITGAALTSTNDTNVTLTLGGTPATALLRAASLTLGWTGTLAVSRGGTGIGTLTGVVIGTGTTAMTAVAGTASQLLRRNTGNTAYEFFTHDFVNQAGARSSISLTTTGTSGAATYSSATGVFNIPNYTYTHPAYTALSPTLTGALVLATFTTDATGHVTAATTRTLTAADIGAATSSHTHAASAITAGTFGSGDFVFQGNLSITGTYLALNSTGGDPSKLRLLGTSTDYTIGTSLTETHGRVDGHATIFTMPNNSLYGWVWKHSAHAAGSGAMSLSTTGNVTIATSLLVGAGESFAFNSPNVNFEVVGLSSFNGNIQVLGQIYFGVVDKGNSGTGTVTFNWTNGPYQKVVLTGNCTFAFSNPQPGTSYQIYITQDATGGRTITWPTIHWKGKVVPTLTGTASSKDIVTITYDGVNYNATISKNHGTP